MRIFSFVALMLITSATLAMSPQPGTWIIAEENTGKPGRGFQIDVQGEIMALYFYGYKQNGDPTYYVAAAPLQGNRFIAELGTVSGGQAFGSPPRDAQYEGSAGDVEVIFETGATGTIKLPNEQTKSIQRFYYGYPSYPEALLGERTITYQIDSTSFSEVYNLTQIVPGTANGNGIVVSNNGRKGCEYQERGDFAGLVLCVETDFSGKLTDSFLLVSQGNDVEGLWSNASATRFYKARGFLSKLPSGRTTGILPVTGTALPEPITFRSDKIADSAHSTEYMIEQLKQHLVSQHTGIYATKIELDGKNIDLEEIAPSLQIVSDRISNVMRESYLAK